MEEKLLILLMFLKLIQKKKNYGKQVKKHIWKKEIV